MKTQTPRLMDLPVEHITSRLGHLLGREREAMLEFLYCLAELQRRHHYAELGFSSLFAYCTEELKLSKACAYRRTTAAALLVQFPAVEGYLASGRLSLTTLCLLRRVLTQDNHRELLERTAGLTEERVELLVATLLPRPAGKDCIRKTSARVNIILPADVTAPANATASANLTAPANFTAPANLTAPAGSNPLLSSDSSHPRPPKRDKVKPINAEEYSFHIYVGQDFMDELAQVKNALSHIIPSGDGQAVLRECFRRVIKECARRKNATLQATSEPTSAEHNFDSPSATKTAVGSGPELALDAGRTEDLARPAGSGPELALDAGRTEDLARRAGSGPELVLDAGRTEDLARRAGSGPELALDAGRTEDLARRAGPGPELALDAGTRGAAKAEQHAGTELGLELGPVENDAYIPAAVRRAVATRDEGRCTFVGINGPPLQLAVPAGIPSPDSVRARREGYRW